MRYKIILVAAVILMAVMLRELKNMEEEGVDLRHRRDKHSIKMDKANHMQELEEEKPRESAEKAFRHKAYENISVQQYLDKVRRK